MALLRDDRNLNPDSRARERSYLALFRLIPWLRPPRRSDENVETRFYTTSTGQNPLEIWCVGSAFMLAWTLLICGALSHLIDFPRVLWPIVFLSSIAAVPLVVVALLGLTEPLARWGSRTFRNIDPSLIHSSVQQAVLLIVSVEASFDSHWVKWVGRAWIALIALELIARVVELMFVRGEAEPSVKRSSG